MKKFHYTYYSYEEYGRGYIGSRSSNTHPEKDLKYFGSFKDKTFKPTQKIILETYETREQALNDEIILHEFYQVSKNSHFANRAKQRSNKFILLGELASKIGKERWAKFSKEERSELMVYNWQQMSEEERSERTRKGWNQISKDKRSERAKKRSLGLTTEQRAEISRKTIMNIPTEQRIGNARKAGLRGGVVTSSQRWQCTETGYIGNAGVLALYQNKRGIDTSKRVKLS